MTLEPGAGDGDAAWESMLSQIVSGSRSATPIPDPDTEAAHTDPVLPPSALDRFLASPRVTKLADTHGWIVARVTGVGDYPNDVMLHRKTWEPDDWISWNVAAFLYYVKVLTHLTEQRSVRPFTTERRDGDRLVPDTVPVEDMLEVVRAAAPGWVRGLTFPAAFDGLGMTEQIALHGLCDRFGVSPTGPNPDTNTDTLAATTAPGKELVLYTGPPAPRSDTAPAPTPAPLSAPEVSARPVGERTIRIPGLPSAVPDTLEELDRWIAAFREEMTQARAELNEAGRAASRAGDVSTVERMKEALKTAARTDRQAAEWARSVKLDLRERERAAQRQQLAAERATWYLEPCPPYPPAPDDFPPRDDYPRRGW